MGNPVYISITSSSSAPTRAVNLDTSQSPFNVSVGVVFGSTSLTAAYGVEFTMDDRQYLDAIGSTRALSWLPDANLPAGTSSGATSNYMFPVAAVRCTVTSLSSSYVVFQVIQGGRA
jgi:hypothetical protein